MSSNRFSHWSKRLLKYFPAGNQTLILDVGSVNTRLILGKKLIFSEPTCLAVHQKTQTVVAFGQKAQELLGKTTADFLVSHPIQVGAVAHPEHFSLFLQTLLQELSLQNHGCCPREF